MAMLVAEVPQVNGQLVELVVPQVSMGQHVAEQGEGQATLTTNTLDRVTTGEGLDVDKNK